MKTYIALLRGINVSGQKIIKMDYLRKLLENEGFEDVKSYIQSGNIIFNSQENQIPILEKRIQEAILNEFGFEVQLIVLLPDELSTSIQSNPLLNNDSLDMKQHYFAFLNENPSDENWQLLKNYLLNGEKIELGEKVIYIHYSDGAGKSKLTTNLIENKLKRIATSRNLNTCRKLLELANS